MISVKRVFPLSDFVRQTKSFAQDIETTKEPIALTVNGKVKMVVVDPESYEAYCRFIEHRDFIEGVMEGQASFARGEGLDAKLVIAELRAKYGL
ncbi:MAG: hypothetical protein JNJ45_11815 [Chthonomonas sp.]|nr:hypothetical protein [Chthonomonas sp.]